MADNLQCAIQDPLPGTATDRAGRRPPPLWAVRLGTRTAVRRPPVDSPTGKPDPGGSDRRTFRRDAGRSRAGTAHDTLHFLPPNAGDELSEPGRRGWFGPNWTSRRPSTQPPRGAGGRRRRGGGRGFSRIRRAAGRGSGVGRRDNTQLTVPEVVSLQFRYFDGRGWSDGWNSLERKSLPAAVEIQLQIASAPSTPARRRAGAHSRGGRTTAYRRQKADGRRPASRGKRPSNGAGSPRVGHTYRVVVDLPGSPSYRPPPVERQPAVFPSARPPARAAHRRPRSTGPGPEPPPRPARRLDQDWITMNTTWPPRASRSRSMALQSRVDSRGLSRRGHFGPGEPRCVRLTPRGPSVAGGSSC